MRWYGILGAAAAAMLTTGNALAGQFNITQFDQSGATRTEFTGISPTTGAIVGEFTTSNVTHAFVKNGNSVTDLNNDPSFPAALGPGSPVAVTPFGINDSGVVSGDFVRNLNQTSTNEGFLFNPNANPAFKVFNQPNAFESFPGGINNAGVVTGQFIDNTVNHLSHAFTQNQNGTGFVQIDPVIAGSTGSSGFNINNHGDVVGEVFITNVGEHGFLLHNGISTEIVVGPGSFTIATGINDSGEIVGTFTGADKKFHSFIDINGVITQFDVALAPGDHDTLAAAVDDNGDIVGSFRDGENKLHAFEATPVTTTPPTTGVPEPGTLALFGGGLLGIAGFRARRRHAG